MCVVVECVNELPRTSDKTPSLTRRQLIVPFDKNFSGVERRYIKDDYLSRPEVLEYVLYKVLTMPDYFEFNEPDACRSLLEEYKELNDPIREFVGEVLPQLKWDLLPYKFLYELFKKWMIKNRPAGKLYNRGKFNNDLLEVVKGNPDWFYRLDAHGKKMDVRVADRMSVWEPLASEYNLDWEWAGPDGHSPPNVDRQQKFKGLERRKLTSGSPSADDD